MKSDSTYAATLLGALLPGLTTTASAQVTFDWAAVDNAGNAADTTGFGSVAIEYRIAKHEVTNDQYAEFLNAVAATDTNGLYNASMASDARGGITQSGTSGSFTYSVKANMGNKPANYVSFFDAMRFVNWLHNGQPTGVQDASTTEDGVYTISDGVSETRAADAQFFIPTENEWYKAAYHQPSAQGGDADNYWLYPTASNSVPTIATANASGDISNPGTNVANYNFGADWNGQNGNVTTVGSASAGSESFYGTSDQGGNVWEWNETLVAGSSRVFRGGGWSNFGESFLQSSHRTFNVPSLEIHNLGFRVGTLPDPCGNGVLDLGEQCDDGVANSDTAPDACRTDCTLATCGDGVVDTGEACDDGNTNETDLCFSTCEINPNPIPGVSEWGLVAMVLLMLTAGTIVLGKRLPRLA